MSEERGEVQIGMTSGRGCRGPETIHGEDPYVKVPRGNPLRWSCRGSPHHEVFGQREVDSSAGAGGNARPDATRQAPRAHREADPLSQRARPTMQRSAYRGFGTGAERRATDERQEGKGRSDAARLPARMKPSKGAPRCGGGPRCTEVRLVRNHVAEGSERSEPHVRHRAARCPVPASRGNRRGGRTTGAERESVPWQARPEGRWLRSSSWSGWSQSVQCRGPRTERCPRGVRRRGREGEPQGRKEARTTLEVASIPPVDGSAPKVGRRRGGSRFACSRKRSGGSNRSIPRGRTGDGERRGGTRQRPTSRGRSGQEGLRTQVPERHANPMGVSKRPRAASNPATSVSLRRKHPDRKSVV